MNDQKVRSRFAPSPTGYLHIGGARTALFAYLYAKHYDGKFILRIEDTDVERSTEDAVQAIIDGMQWLGLTPDEGPFFQTKRMDRYNAVLDQLLREGKAYRCDCTKERLEKLRMEQTEKKEKPRYDENCREKQIDSHVPHVIRFKNPTSGAVSWNDQVCGTITIQNAELDDLIIARSDGMPTYNFTVVVDDWDMGITEVIRGNDHINNTPRQINLFFALGVTPPEYAHVPMIADEHGKKLSKREGAANLLMYREQGYLPCAVLNYLVRLGWSHGDQEIFSLEEMIRFFDASHISASPASINPEKLAWINQHYLKTLPPESFASVLAEQFARLNVDIHHGPKLEEIIRIQAERCKTLKEMAERSVYFFQDPKEYDAAAIAKNITPEILPALQMLLAAWDKLAHWNAAEIHAVLNQIADNLK